MIIKKYQGKTEEEAVEAARKELDDQLSEYPYSCPIPDDVKPNLEMGD